MSVMRRGTPTLSPPCGGLQRRCFPELALEPAAAVVWPWTRDPDTRTTTLTQRPGAGRARGGDRDRGRGPPPQSMVLLQTTRWGSLRISMLTHDVDVAMEMWLALDRLLAGPLWPGHRTGKVVLWDPFVRESDGGWTTHDLPPAVWSADHAVRSTRAFKVTAAAMETWLTTLAREPDVWVSAGFPPGTRVASLL